MDVRVRYLAALTVYVAAAMVVFTIAASALGDLTLVDSIYFVVHTMWTVGYGDIVITGNGGKLLTVAIVIFGTVAVLSAIGIISAIILDGYVNRQSALDRSIRRGIRSLRNDLYAWADEHGVERSEIDAVVKGARDVQKR